MARINLLPWRAERRKQRQQEFQIYMFLAFIVGAALSYGAVVYVQGLIDHQDSRNKRLEQEIAKLETKIKTIEQYEQEKANLLQRKQIIEELQASRSQMVHLFDELVSTIPDGVQLASIKQEGSQLTLEGVAQSYARVSAYMRNFERANWLTGPDVQIITADGDAAPATENVRARATDKRLKFILRVKVKTAQVGEEEEVVEGSL